MTLLFGKWKKKGRNCNINGKNGIFAFFARENETSFSKKRK